MVGKVFNCAGPGMPQVGVDAFDIDHDERMDVVCYNWGGGQFLFVKGNGDGTFQTPVVIAAGLAEGVGIAAPFAPRLAIPVGGTVSLPSPAATLLALAPWLLLAVVAVGLGAYAMRRRYASPILARIR